SVLIPTFNGSRFIDATLRSALAQTVDDIEILVLDDGSTDDTVARVEAIGDRRIRLSRHTHAGAPTALNAGLGAARGAYVALLDHDDLWLPHKLERQLDYFDRHPGTTVTFSWSALIDECDRPLSIHPPRWQGPISFRDLLADYVVGPSSSIVLRRDAVQ